MLSAQVGQLIEAECSPHGGRARIECYPGLGKWLVHVLWVPFYLRRQWPHLRKRAPNSVHFIPRASGIPRYQFIRPRDKETCKVSFFDTRSGLKVVRYSNRAALDAELEASHELEKRGVRVAPISKVDKASCRIVQPFIGELFSSYAPLEAILDVLIARSDKETVQAPSEWLCEHYSAIARGAELAGLDADSLLSVTSILESDATVGSEVATRLAHGDVSHFNFLQAHGGEVYVTDFDRCFLASHVYDLVYLHVNGSLDRTTLVDALAANAARTKLLWPFDPDLSCKVALALFVADNLRYLNATAATVGPDERWYSRARFTIGLSRKAAAALGSMARAN